MKIDQFTASHLEKYCRQEFWRDPYFAWKRVVEFLESLNEEDGKFWIEKGWKDIADHLKLYDDFL